MPRRWPRGMAACAGNRPVCDRQNKMRLLNSTRLTANENGPPAEFYTSGEYWRAHPDYLAGQAPGKVSHVLNLIDFVELVLTSRESRFSLVDIGCGAGKVGSGVADYVRQRFPGHTVALEGYDLSPQAIEAARRENAHGVFVCGDFREAGKTWDLALLCDVIEHVPDPEEFLDAVARRARYFIVGFAMDDNLANWLIPSRKQQVHRSGHISLFSETSAFQLSCKNGEVLAASYIRNPISRSLQVSRPHHLLTLPLRFCLRITSRRFKGRVFGGESIYVAVRSRHFAGHTEAGGSAWKGGA